MKNLRSEYISKSPETRLHGVDIPIIGLTGGIATGKSTVSRLLREQGLIVLDADQLIKEIYAQEESFDFISKTFPQAIKNNHIDFKILREIAFHDDSNRQQLEQFLYKKLPDIFKKHIPNNCRLIIYDVPLLFEKGLHDLVDLTVCVYSPVSTQLERLLKRDKIENSLAEKIIQKQMPIETKKSLADTVIFNTGDLDGLKLEVDDFLEKYLQAQE